MHHETRKLQTALLMLIGPQSETLTTAAVAHGITEENCKDVVVEMTSMIKDMMNQNTPFGDSVPYTENTGLYNLQRIVYVDGQLIVSEEDHQKIRECFEQPCAVNDKVFPTAVHTLRFNIDTLMTRTVQMILEGNTISDEDKEHCYRHVGRLVSYLLMMDAYTTHCANRNYNRHTIAEELLDSAEPVLPDDWEASNEEQMMLYEGAECLLSGRTPKTRGEHYTEGVLSANRIHSVFGCEAWYDGIVNAVKKIIEKIKEGLKKVGDFFRNVLPSRQKRLSVTTKAVFDELKEKVTDKSEFDGEKIDAVVEKVEGVNVTLDELKSWIPKVKSEINNFSRAKGKEIPKAYEKFVIFISGLHDAWLGGSKLHETTEAITDVERKLEELKNAKEGDKADIAAKREALNAELTKLKEQDAEGAKRTAEYDALSVPCVAFVTNIKKFIKFEPA